MIAAVRILVPDIRRGQTGTPCQQFGRWGFPGPLFEPDVPIPEHPALGVIHAVGVLAHGFAILV
jgi:hypothetical protein